MATTRYSAIDSTGVLHLARSDSRYQVFIQNVGTVPLVVYPSVDGTGDPEVIIAGGSANDDGLGGAFSDSWQGPLWIKAPAGTGRALVTSH